MRQYTDSWSSTVTKTTSPYYIASGAQTTLAVASGKLRMASASSDYSTWETGIVRGTVGSVVSSDTLAPQGSFAMQFVVNSSTLVTAQGITAHAQAVATTEPYPILYCVGSALRLMWTTSGFYNEFYGTAGYRGDFNGIDVSESGDWTILSLRKDFTGSTSNQMLIAVAPSGAVYKTGWFAQTDNGHQILSLYTERGWWNYSPTYMEVSSVSYADQLTDAEIAKIVDAASIDDTPRPILDNGTGDYDSAVVVTLSAPSDLTADYTEIRYTLDGTEPTASSTLYAGPITVGSPYTPGTTKTLKCAYFSGTLGKARTRKAVYTFKVLDPIPTFIPKGQTYDYFSGDVALDWTKAPPTGVEYWYTLDGTDPKTSGAAIKWVSGAKYLFNSHPDPVVVGYGRQSQLANYLAVRAKHVASGVWSTMTTPKWTLYFRLTSTGYPTVGTVGGFNKDLSVSWSMLNPPVPVTTKITIDGTTTNHTESSGSFVIPFGSFVNYSIQALSDDGLLSTSTKSGTATFGQYAPTLSRKAIITSADTAEVIVTNLNPDSSIAYTTDGSSPTSPGALSSTQSVFSVSVPNGSMLRALAVRNYVTSPVVVSEVFREYDVSDAVTATLEGSSYHYYSATQRVELNAPLGDTLTDITVGSNVSNTAVSGTVDGKATTLFLWDTADQKGTVNSALTKLNVSDFKTKFWSRLSFSTATAALSYGFDKTVWMTPGGTTNVTSNLTGSFVMFRIAVVSKASAVTFDYVVDCDTYQATIKRTRTPHGGTTSTVSSVSAGTLATGTTLNNTLTVTVGNNSITLSDGTGTSTETLAGDDIGAYWFIEGSFNPEATDIPAISTSAFADTSVDMSVSLTTTATSGKLRRAPATVFVDATTSFVTSTKSIAFADKESVVAQDIYVPCGPLKAHAAVSYDKQLGSAVIDGPFEWKLPYVFDSSAAFDVSVDFNTHFDKSAGQDITLYASAENYSGSATGIDIGAVFATLRCVQDSDANGTAIVGSSALELYAGSAATRIVAPTAQSRFKLRLVRASGSNTATAYGYVGGTEVAIGTVTVPTASPLEFKLVRKGKTARPNPMHTLIFGASASGDIRTNAIASAQISGALLMRKGAAVSIPATSITPVANSVKAVFFSTATHLVTVEDLSFEPSDGRILLGILDTRNGSATWTGLLFSKTVRVRSDVAGTLGQGYIVGAGVDIAVEAGRVSWLSSGYKQSLPIGSLEWIRPNVYVDLFRKKQIVRTFERQPLKITLSAGPKA